MTKQQETAKKNLSIMAALGGLLKKELALRGRGAQFYLFANAHIKLAC